MSEVFSKQNIAPSYKHTLPFPYQTKVYQIEWEHVYYFGNDYYIDDSLLVLHNGLTHLYCKYYLDYYLGAEIKLTLT